VTTLRNRQPDDWRKRTSHAPQSVHQALQDGLLRVVSAVDGAQCSGAVELDDRGRRNIIWLAGEPTGFRYEAGIPVAARGVRRDKPARSRECKSHTGKG